MTGRFPTSVDLAGFAPQVCESCGRDMRIGSGNRHTSTFPCQCPGIKADPQRRLHHVEVLCDCGIRYFDPPHSGI